MRDSLVRRGRHGAVHGADTRRQAQANDGPRVGGHDSNTPTTLMECPGRDANNTNAQARMHKGFIQIAPFIERHSSIFTRFSIEDKVDSYERASKDASAVQQPLSQVAGIRSRNLIGLLHVRTTKIVTESIARLIER